MLKVRAVRNGLMPRFEMARIYQILLYFLKYFRRSLFSDNTVKLGIRLAGIIFFFIFFQAKNVGFLPL